MRVTQSLLRQHIGWHFQNHWRVQGRRRPMKTPAEKILKQNGIDITDPNDFLKDKVVYEKVNIVGYGTKPTLLNETHPNWHERTLLTYKDNNVLLEGLTQAKILTNTVEIKEGLPDNIHLPEIPREFNKRVKKIILGSHILDAEQKKLPKLKDPERPSWNFPRSYGVTQNRVYKLFISKLLNLIETTSNHDLVKERYLADGLYFSFPFEKYGELFQFQMTGNNALFSTKPLNSITSDSAREFELPDIYPVKPTITLNKENIYTVENVYPISKHFPKFHPHTLFINYDKEEVKNIFEENVTETQIHGRSLLKTFTAAAAYAKERYGKDIEDLPAPVVLQAIQTDGRTFYFGILQLNTLDLESAATKNIWYQAPAMTLFDSCSYQVGKPVLEGYNREVTKHLLAFYNNI